MPRVRQVVHRGFMEEERGVPNERTAFLTTTDVRSPKAAEIHARPNVEVDWYIHPAKVQVGGPTDAVSHRRASVYGP